VPGLGATGGSKFSLSVGWREATSTKSYLGFYHNSNISTQWIPHERLSIMDVSARYVVSPRISIQAVLPIVFNNFSMLYPPNGPGQGTRYQSNANGIGDLSIFGQTYLLKPQTHPFGNVAVGIGMKIPTGNYNVQADLPNLSGTGIMQRAAYPPAIEPGDGGTGIIFGINGYRQFRKSFLRGHTMFASASYLANSRGTNGTQSIVSSLGVPLAPQFLNELTNAVTDSYNMQVGTSIKIPGTWDKPKLQGLRGRLSWNWEGIPCHNLIGNSPGYRQPGYIMSIAPGMTYAIGRSLIIAEVPIVFNRYVNGKKSAIPDLLQNPDGSLSPAPFDKTTNLGMVPQVAVSLRYVQTF
jgi:hypothetical protein